MASKKSSLCDSTSENVDCPHSKKLSAHDSQILDRIFNPNLPYSDVIVENDESTEADGSYCDLIWKGVAVTIQI